MDGKSFLLLLDCPALIKLISLSCASNMCLILQNILDTIWNSLTKKKKVQACKALPFDFNQFMELSALNHKVFSYDGYCDSH